MHRSFLSLSFAVTAALIINGPAYAQRGHGGGKPTTTPTAHGPSTTHGSSSTTTHGQSGSHGPATKPTSTTHGSGSTHGSAGSNTHGGGKPSTSNAGSTTTATSNTSPNSGAGSTTTLSPVQQKLQKNTNLADKLLTRLPKNTDLMAAAEGFKNLGQFVAAVNVSNNLGLDFTELKTRMVDDHMSLGQAIQDTKKTADVETEVRRAETEADSMIKSTTNSTTSSTSTTSTTTTKTRKTSGNK